MRSSFLALSLTASAAAVASAASCDLLTLVPLLADARNDACFASSGVWFPPVSAPTDAQWAKTCAVEACTTLFDDLLAATAIECAIGEFAAHADLVNKYRIACGLPLATSDASPSSSSSSSSQEVKVPTTSTSGSSDTEITPVEEVETPAPTTTQPKRNSTTVVEALTNAAPSSTLASLAGSALVAVVAALVL